MHEAALKNIFQFPEKERTIKATEKCITPNLAFGNSVIQIQSNKKTNLKNSIPVKGHQRSGVA